MTKREEDAVAERRGRGKDGPVLLSTLVYSLAAKRGGEVAGYPFDVVVEGGEMTMMGVERRLWRCGLLLRAFVSASRQRQLSYVIGF